MSLTGYKNPICPSHKSHSWGTKHLIHLNHGAQLHPLPALELHPNNRALLVVSDAMHAAHMRSHFVRLLEAMLAYATEVTVAFARVRVVFVYLQELARLEPFWAHVALKTR